MSVGVHINSDLFIITVDGSNTLSKNKEDVFCSVSNSDSSVVNIYETTPNESGRNLIFSSAYSNFTSPTGSTASSVCIAINDLLKYGSPQNEIKPKPIEVVLSSSVTTNSLQCLSRFISNGTNYLNEFEKTGTISGITPLVLVPSEFIATYVSIYNSDTASATVTVRSNNSGTYTILCKVTLSTGSHLVYTQGSGWQIFTSAGAAPATGTGSYLEIANNLSDVASASTAFSNIKQAATETATGVAEIATQAETNTGTDDARFVTPLKFQTRLAAFAQPLDADLTAIAALTPTNDDVLQYKSGAWSNRTIAQYYADLQASVKDDVYFTIPIFAGSLSPADSTTYYVGIGGLAPNTTATNHDFSVGCDFTAIGAIIAAGGNSTSGSTEDNTLQLRNVTDNTNTSIGTFKTNGSTTSVVTSTVTGLNISVDAADMWCLRWDAPAYATNPIGVIVRVLLICKRR